MVLDIGGTTTDMAVLIDQAPLLDRLGIEIGHHKTLIRSLRTRPIAVGGDSQVRVVEGELSIGPERLGPAMAYGGPAATPTDAFFVLGKETQGDMEAAQRGIRDIADQLGLLPREAAERIFDQACRMIIHSAREMIAAINSKPVYTVHELLDGYQVRPRHLMVLGGPALQFAERLATLSDFQVKLVPRWQVANAIGAAMARTTSEVTLFADTERKIAVAPEEDFRQPISSHFNKQDAVELAMGLLREKALREGADIHDLELDVLEEVQFNMVRGFSTAGRNIRVKVQIKPGLIGEHRAILDKLTTPPPADTAPAS
jgi:N-methylhydantoinase A/oxoprolinase/acetone carboxylase beta subunit